VTGFIFFLFEWNRLRPKTAVSGSHESQHNQREDFRPLSNEDWIAITEYETTTGLTIEEIDERSAI
jgi:hypothetical protein